MKTVFYSLVFNRKNEKLKNTDVSLIQICVYFDGKRRYISTGIRVEKQYWSESRKEVVKHPKALEYNKVLRQKLLALQDYEIELTSIGQAFNLDSLDSFLEGKDFKSFIDYMEQEITARQGISERTRSHHFVTLRRLKEFGKIKLFRDLTYENILEWDRSMHRSVSIKKQGTIYNQHIILKIYINSAIASKRFDPKDHPYLNFKAKKGNNTYDRKYLTEEELQRMEECQFEGTADMVRDLFLFCCLAGLAYCDAFQLCEDDFKYEEGHYFIDKDRNKTGV
ncbi:MAG TPA: phage integrase SAM-like domain-containing protein [Bacteroidales bacterium]|nr:phage integrase SAM-like domain-containing protein [Bacteroidales bacterium]